MAKPNPKGPETTVRIFCAHCKAKLFRYRKGGTGSLVKCFRERIVEDYTNGDLHCRECGVQFARETMIRGVPAYKIIGGKVMVKR